MSTAAGAARVPAQARARPRSRAQPARRFPRRRVAGGVAWIAVVTALLAGVVALNVAVLRLNLELDELGGERARLRADIAELQSRVADSASDAQIRSEARRNDLRPFDPAATRFITLAPHAR